MEVKIGKRFFDSILWPYLGAMLIVRWFRGLPDFFVNMTASDKDTMSAFGCVISVVGGVIFFVLSTCVSHLFWILVYFAVAGFIYSVTVHNDYCKSRLKGQRNYKEEV